MGNQFFERDQIEITNQKLQVYQRYVEPYIMTVLVGGYTEILISDLFCGPGHNAKKKGSPLIILDVILACLESPQIEKGRKLGIHLLFSDKDPENIQNLKKAIQKYMIPACIHIHYKDTDFSTTLKFIQTSGIDPKIPKFFFLDPFNYSSVNIQDLLTLFTLGRTEILLFSPVFHIYRFHSSSELLKNDEHKTRKFIEEFTIDGLRDYEDIYDFNNAIRDKLKKFINIDLVKYILLDSGGTKNVLFHITSHIAGSLLFTKTARKLGDYGMGIDVKYKEKIKMQGTLFDLNVANSNVDNTLAAFEKFLIDTLEISQMSNIDISTLSIVNGFLPSEARSILNKYKEKNLLDIKYTSDMKKGLYISENCIRSGQRVKCLIKIIS